VKESTGKEKRSEVLLLLRFSPSLTFSHNTGRPLFRLDVLTTVKMQEDERF